MARQLQRLAGKAAREVVRPGTAGEYDAVVLYCGDGERVILQRRGGNPFHDEETLALVGHEVEVKGYRVDIGNVFRFIEARIIDV